MNFALTQFLLCLPIVIVNSHYFTNGFKNLFRRSPNMDSLIAIGSAAAIVYGVIALYEIGMGLGAHDMVKVHSWAMDMYFETSAMILTLITLGKYLETRSKGKTSEAIAKLMDLAPKTAWVRRGEEFVEIPVEDVRPGDRLRVKPGQSVPVDGVIVQGSAAFDESAITGESIPVERTVGEKIIGATVNKNRRGGNGGDVGRRGHYTLADHPAGGGSVSLQSPDRQAGRSSQRRLRSRCDHDRPGGRCHLAASGRIDQLRGIDRNRRPGHFLSVRAGAGNADRDHGRHRQGRGERHSDQIRRSAGNGAFLTNRHSG